MSLLGFPIVRYIDIDDAESVLRAIRDTARRAADRDRPAHAGRARARREPDRAGAADHPGRVTAVVPHYAMSGGTLIALAADEIVIDRTRRARPRRPAARPVPGRVARRGRRLPGEHNDQTLIMADVGRKAIAQVEGFTRGCSSAHLTPERARERGAPARRAASGRTTTRCWRASSSCSACR